MILIILANDSYHNGKLNRFYFLEISAVEKQKQQDND